MSIAHAVVLGIIQGLTEFLPVSSTAHLVIIPWLLGWPDPGKAFDVALHIGTLGALLVYFRKDWAELLQAAHRKLLTLVVVGCIPAALAVFVQKKAESLSNPDVATGGSHLALPIIATSLIVFAVLLKWADTAGRKKKPIESLTTADAVLIGFGQFIAAVLPGASRSGTTITLGLTQGLTREAAVRFSFLLSAPTIAAVALYEVLKHHKEMSGAGSGSLAAGILVSGIVGYAAIAFLMDYVKRKSMDIFVWYRIVVGIAILGLYFMRK